MRRKHFDATLVLGDLVGYGAGAEPGRRRDPRARRAGLPKIRGNHDKVASGIEDGSNFNHAALAAARWTAEHLTAANLRFVRELERGPVVLPEGFTICHGSPLDEDQLRALDLRRVGDLLALQGDLVFFGHTHVPSLFVSQRRRDAGRAAARGRAARSSSSRASAT